MPIIKQLMKLYFNSEIVLENQQVILRSNCSSPNARRDSIVLSILSTEWFESVRDHLKAKAYKL